MNVSGHMAQYRGWAWSRRIVLGTCLIALWMARVQAGLVSELIDSLQSPQAEDRCRTIEKLGQSQDKTAIPELARLMDDPDLQIRYTVIKALGQLHATSRSEAIAERLKDESPLIRIASAEALGRLGSAKTIPALTAVLQDRNSDVRAQAAKALGNLKARTAESALTTLCTDPDPDVRIAAVHALVKLRSRTASTHIEPLVRDFDDGVRVAARKAIRELRTIWAHIGLVLLAILPALIMLQRYHRMDWREPEPTVKVYEAFTLGVASAALANWLNFLVEQAFPSVILGMAAAGQPTSGALWTAGAVGIVEEGCKFLVMIVFIWRWPDFDDRFDGILYSAAVGLGFAAYENLYYVLELGIQVGILRALLSVPVHATCGILMGYFFGLAKWRQLKWPHYPKRLLFYGYAAAAVFHAVWDAIGFQKEIISAFFFLAITVFALWLRRKVMRQFFEKA